MIKIYADNAERQKAYRERLKQSGRDPKKSNTDVAMLRTENVRLKSALAALKSENEKLEVDNETLRGTVASLQSENQALKVYIDDANWKFRK